MEKDFQIPIGTDRRKNIELALDLLIDSYQREIAGGSTEASKKKARSWSLYAFDLNGKEPNTFWQTLSFLADNGVPIKFDIFDATDFPEEAYGEHPENFEIGRITVSGDYKNLHKELWDTYVLGVESNTTSHSIKLGQPIHSIACVAPEEFSEHFTVIVNENYSSPIKASKKAKYWSLLLSVADGEKVRYEADEHRNSINTLNYIQDCSLYTQSGCACTKVIVIEGRYITAAPSVSIKTIRKKMFTQNINKLKAT